TVLGDGALHAVRQDRIKVGEVTNHLQGTPFAGYRPGQQLLAAHTRDGVAQRLHARQVRIGQFGERRHGLSPRKESRGRRGHSHHRRTWSWAARTVLYSSMVMVMGPTPPGTGVMAEASGRTTSKSTSPVSRPSGSRFMPTSTTAAPGRTMSAVRKWVWPMA